MSEDEPTKEKSKFKKFTEEVNSLKVFAASLVVLLPLAGANIKDFGDWTSSIYNINTNMSTFVTKEDTLSLALDVLLYIEPAIRNDITSLEFTIDMEVKSDNPDQSVIDELRREYRDKVIELDRIRSRIKLYDPTWLSIDEVQP